MADIFVKWHYMDYNWRGAGMVHGPLTTSQLEELLAMGEVTGKTLVRYDNKGLWKPMRDIPALSRIATSADSKRRYLEFWRKHKVAIIACVVFVGLFIYRWRMPASFHVDQNNSAYRYSSSREPLTKDAVIKLTNSVRTQHGLPSLRENGLLNVIAEARGKDMFEKRYFGSVSPDGPQFADLARSVGYPFKSINQVLARGTYSTNKMVVDSWMQNSATRQSILAPEMEEIGMVVLSGRMNEQETSIVVLVVGVQRPAANK